MPEEIVIYGDTEALDCINAFQKALKPFGLYIEDTTPPNADCVSIAITKDKPEKEWKY